MSSSKHANATLNPLPPPPIFEEFFTLGQQETASPFIAKNSRQWGAHLTMKAAILAAILLLLAFCLSFFPEQLAISNILLVTIYFLAGTPAAIEAIEDLSCGDINLDILMTIAAFSSVLIGSSMEGALLLILFALSGSMEDAVTGQAKNAINSLHKLSPTCACVIEPNGTILERSVKEISVGTLILIKSGQVVPLDGTVIEGISSVNLVHLTGENFPVTKKVGDTLPAGARNLEGTLTVCVTHSNANSTLTRIIQLVTQAQEARPTLQRWFDKVSRSYAIAIIVLSTLFAVSLPFFIAIPYLGIEGSIYRALAFLIAASPCALIIAIPIAYLSAVSSCARCGILLKGGITLDALAGCSAIAFDKTGTLTTGDLILEGIEGLEETTPAGIQEALAVAYALEKNAVHPIAKALMDYAQGKNIAPLILQDFKAIPGYGLQAIVLGEESNQNAYLGHSAYIARELSDEISAKLLQQTAHIHARGELLAVLLLGKRLFLLRFRDTVRPTIKATLEELKNRHKLQLVMLTGDHENSAKKIAKELGIEEYRANLRPEDKLHYVNQASERHGLAMVGDGINDAPALARAQVGICMGKMGSTAAIDAADVVLLHDNIELLSWLMQKARQTKAIVNQNLLLASAAIIMASIPALAGLIPLWLAVILHEGGTVLVGLNGLRLLKK